MKKNDFNEYGKMPPQAVELEEAILGAIMLEPCINEVADILKPESFYKDAHNKIYTAILNLHKKSYPVDILTVTEELKKIRELDNVGGAYYVTQLTNRVASGANVEYHARIIAQKYIQRELIRISTITTTNAYDSNADSFDLIEELEKNLTSITNNISTGKISTISKLWNQVAERNEILLQKKGLSGVPSGYPVLDTITGGWQKTDLIIIAARPAMGKTGFICNLAVNAAVKFKKSIAIFSLEMSALQIGIRLFSLQSNLRISEFMRKGIPVEQMFHVNKDCSQLIDSSLYIDDTPGLTLMELRSKARKLKREKNIELIIIDYLQLMEGIKDNRSQTNREQVISSISRGLKTLAKELDIPIIALSQLSRASENRGGDKRPMLSDLRESGAIEQDADIVAFIHRPEYYGIMEYAESGESSIGIAEINFSKNRHGGIGTEKLRFIKEQVKFESLNISSPYPVDFSISMKENEDFLNDKPF